MSDNELPHHTMIFMCQDMAVIHKAAIGDYLCRKVVELRYVFYGLIILDEDRIFRSAHIGRDVRISVDREDKELDVVNMERMPDEGSIFYLPYFRVTKNDRIIDEAMVVRQAIDHERRSWRELIREDKVLHTCCVRILVVGYLPFDKIGRH